MPPLCSCMNGFRPFSDAAAPKKESGAGQGEQDGDGIPGQVVGQQVDVVTDLMKTEQLVLDGSVVQLEQPGSEEQAAEPPAPIDAALPPEIGEEEERGYRRQPAEGMKDAVGHQADIGS